MARSTPPATIWRFGEFELDGARCELLRQGRKVPVEPKVFDLLAYLLGRRDRVVGRDELFAALWPGESVSESALSYCVKAARKAIGDDGRAQHSIATVKRRGFRFIAPATADSEAASAPVSESPANAPVAAPSGFFVGREPIMARLRGALTASRAGRGRVALIAGEPGIGKTRTAEELSRVARGEGFEVLCGRCDEGAGAPPFWPWIQILRAFAERRDPIALQAIVGRGSGDLAALVPELGGPGARRPARSHAGGEDARFRLFDAIARFLRRVAEDHALLVVLDDLHWADTSSLLLLAFLANDLGGSRLLVLGAYRDTEAGSNAPLAACLAQIARTEGADRIALDGLTPADLERFLHATTGVPPSAKLVRAIHEQTGGNPFFATETLRVLLADGADAEVAVERFAVPSNVCEAVARRCEALSPRARRVLRAAAVIGRDFEWSLLRRVLDGKRRTASDAWLAGLDEAVAARLIEARASGDRLRFTHSLVRETLYQALPSAARARLHGDVGRAIADLYAHDLGPHLAALAHHFAAAAVRGDPTPAIDYATRAGDRAAEMAAYEEAAAHYSRAAELIEQAGGASSTGTRARCVSLDEVRLRRGENLWKAGDFSGAKSDFQRVAQHVRSTRAATLLARAALGFGGGFRGFDFGVVEPDLVALLEEALRALPTRPSPLRARVLARLAVALYSLPGSLARRQELSSQAVRMAEEVGDTPSLLAALYSRHWALWGPDTLPDRLAAANAMLAIAERDGERESALHAFRFRLIDSLELGDLAAVDADLAAFLRLAHDLRQPYYDWFAAQMRSMRALLAGAIEESERLAEEALVAGRRAQSRNVEPIYWSQMLWIRREQGRLAEVEPMFRAGVEAFPALPAWRCALALLLSELGRAGDARAHFDLLARDDFATIPQNAFWMASLAAMGDVCVDLGDLERAAVLYPLLAPYAGRVVEASVGSTCLGSLDRTLGRLAALLGRPPEAAAHFAAALAAERRLAAPLLLARTERDQELALEERRRSG